MSKPAKAKGDLFVHLRVHSAYSLLEGALPISKLAPLTLANEMPALALTDTNNLFGALEFSEAFAGKGIQPIVGCTLDIAFETAVDREELNGSGEPAIMTSDGHVALLAKDSDGYTNLMALTSKAFLENGVEGDPCVSFADLRAHAEGLLILTGGPDGPIDRAIANGDEPLARDRLEALAACAPQRVYVELQRHGLASEMRVEPKLLSLADALGLPIVATNEAYFPSADDFDAHDALICIAEGKTIAADDRRQLTREHSFKSPAEMVKLFADLPEAIENTIEIARRCSFRPTTRDPILPQSVQLSSVDGDDVAAHEAEELRRQAETGLERRLELGGPAPDTEIEAYRERLDFELNVITRMNYSGYFLIVSDFIKWAKAQDIAVGPGRGSGAGSVVAWALTITDLDPLRFGLLFERFLNPERVSMPDFDIDFCQERRDEVIRYVQQKYGEDRVAQIITFGKLQARAVLRDVGRVLQMPYGQVDGLCKLVPNNPAAPVTLPEAIEGEPRLQEARDSEPIVEQLLDIGQKLEGLYRHASTHAAGIVIGDRPLHELVPLYQDPRSTLPATQFNMKWVEPAGLVKFDFLGLKTLTVIEKAVALIARRGITLDPARIPLDDAKTFGELGRGETVGVFQLESSGMREALRKLKPDRFEDIIAMVALYRPGPMDNIESFVNRKHGTEQPDYLHDLIRPILEETYGVIIYQEQVMQIAQVLSGYSLGEADLLRRAMGKKIKAEMDQQKSRFIEGAVENNVDRGKAEYIFELVAKFAGYGFNKSHAAAYALIAYHTAYLKANYPVEFIAASMTLDMANTDKIALFARDAQRIDIELEPPSINESEADFAPSKLGIRYALAALKNMGRAVAEHICELREKDGPFRDIADFANRLNPRIVNKRAVEMLAVSGALDNFGYDRATLFENAGRILGAANQSNDDRISGQNNLFDMSEATTLELRKAKPWLPMDILSREFDAVGFFLSGHPLDEYDDALAALGVDSWLDFCAKVRRGHTAGTIAATVIYRQDRRSRSGNRFAFAGFSDRSGQFEAIVFSEALTQAQETLVAGEMVLVKLEGELDDDSVKARVQSVEALDSAAARAQSGLAVVIDDIAALDDLAETLAKQGRGKIRILLQLADAGREVEFEMPGGFDTSPTQASALRLITGVKQVDSIARLTG